MQSRYRALIKPLAIALATVTVLSACGQGAQQGAGGAPGGPGMPSVGVIVAEASSVPLVSELSGRTTPFMVAELRPQVSGIVHKRLFTEGSEVK
ncbi:MAG: efflux transporter periplasmic adaptor subunit, partial [Parazoarcus communis]